MEKTTQIIYNTLQQKYNITIGKSELSKILGVSESYINKCLMQGKGIPNYKKLGNSKNSKVIWNLSDVSDFIYNTTKVYHC
ncbi:MAG: hypothetical protein U9R39_04755 [Campylobacterota bacterium]|nr:hypothetical protein [Campylobacterota bacterium]